MKPLILASALACLVAVDARSQSICDRLADAVEASAKEISFYAVDGALDNSAPRTTNRKLEESMHVGLIQANLSLMQANKCTLPKVPFSENSYRENAFACMTAAASSDDPTKQLPECDREKWKRSR